ncbi:hypothetical protein [Methylobacterium sp. JK268]
MEVPTLDDVRAAEARIAPHIHRTPILTSRMLNDLSGAALFFEGETLQEAGAFKARWATSAVPLAAILRHRDTFAGKRVGVIVTGGNVDLDALPWMSHRAGATP